MYQLRCKMTFILNIQLSFGFQLSFSRRDLFIVTIVEVHVHHICNSFFASWEEEHLQKVSVQTI